MSTRCMVFFQDDEFPTSKPEKVRFYQHSDGYPSNVAKDLADFFAKYNQVHSPTPDYHDSGSVAAHFINFAMERSFRSCVQSAVRRLKRAKADGEEYWIKSAEEMLERNRNYYRYMGYRIVPNDEFHDDIEWLYVVTPTRVHVYHTQHNKRGTYNDFEARNNKDNWILVSTMEESWDIRHGSFPKRFAEVSEQDLYQQRVDEFLEEEQKAIAASPQLSICSC